MPAFGPEARRDRILVVDDEVEITKCLKRLLAREGFEVEVACGPEEALARLDAFRPDMVLSDFRMPGMNGAELLAKVKRRLPLALRVITSGHADLDTVLAGVNVGEICRFIKKPWDDRELVSQLRTMLANRAVQEAARLVVEAKLTGATFTVDQAVALIARFAGAIDDEQNFRLVGGHLTQHAGKITFVAELGGQQTPAVELPLRSEKPRQAG